MKHFAVTVVVIIIVVAVIAYIETGFVIPHNPLITATSTVSGSAPSSISTTTGGTTPTTTISNRGQLYPCVDLSLSSSAFNTSTLAQCLLTSNKIGIWAAAGNANTAHLLVTGADNRTYVNQTITYNCTTFITNFTGPKQAYNVTFKTGYGGGSCGQSILVFNSTTEPPKKAYSFVYNGNFANGQYTGWTVSGKGFGTAPLNITYANNGIKKCYVGYPWSNSPGPYVASTYMCGTQTSPGNLTSSPFVVNKPFLNFKIVSKPHGNLYVEIITSNQTAISAEYNTYNLSLPNSTIKNKNVTTSVFRNASIPLTVVAGKVVQIRLVSSAVGTSYFMLAGGFQMSGTPNQEPGILVNLTFYNTT